MPGTLRLLLILALLPACKTKTVDAELATQRLCNQVAKNRQRMLVNRLGGDTVWSDGALLERAPSFPAQLQALIGRPTEQRDMLAMLQDLDNRKAAWQRAQLRHDGEGDFGCRIRAGKVEAPVNCIYTTYLQARYPDAVILLKSALEPIRFVVDGTLRAALMPVKS